MARVLKRPHQNPLAITTFIDSLNWIDGRPLHRVMEPYRRSLFERFFGKLDARGHPFYNLGLFGRSKKNWKSADAVVAGLYALTGESLGGSQVLLVSNDEGQSADNLSLAKKIIQRNPALKMVLAIQLKTITRRDGRGFMQILPAKFAVGEHGKTFRLLIVDEIHGHRDYNLLEALQPDPHRPDCQTWITSYASIFHKPGVPLFDLMQLGKTGTDPRMLFSWYGGDFTTDPNYRDKSPEERANPSLASFTPGYLEQQQRRLPAHKYRRLHLNLAGLPEGSAFQPEPIMDAIDRGVRVRQPEPGITYHAFVDMSGGSNDDATLAIGHQDANDHSVLDLLMNQGQAPPFDPIKAVERFCTTLKAWGIHHVTGDRFAGNTFQSAFQERGMGYQVADQTASEAYEAMEPLLNSSKIILLDHPEMESQLLSLIWKGGKITHPSGEHDDFANACAGLVNLLAAGIGPELLPGIGQRIARADVPFEDLPSPGFPMPGRIPVRSKLEFW